MELLVFAVVGEPMVQVAAEQAVVVGYFFLVIGLSFAVVRRSSARMQ